MTNGAKLRNYGEMHGFTVTAAQAAAADAMTKTEFAKFAASLRNAA